MDIKLKQKRQIQNANNSLEVADSTSSCSLFWWLQVFRMINEIIFIIIQYTIKSIITRQFQKCYTRTGSSINHLFLLTLFSVFPILTVATQHKLKPSHFLLNWESLTLILLIQSLLISIKIKTMLMKTRLVQSPPLHSIIPGKFALYNNSQLLKTRTYLLFQEIMIRKMQYVSS